METKDLIKLASNTKIASRKLSVLTDSEKNSILTNINKNLLKNIDIILKSNSKDIKNAKASGKDYAFIDRLTLTEKKIKNMAFAIQNIIELENPVGQIIEEKTLERSVSKLDWLEEKLSNIYQFQEIRCPMHLSIGQEGVAVGISNNLKFQNKYIPLYGQHVCRRGQTYRHIYNRHAALYIVVFPSASTAAIKTFAVPVTEASSRRI